MHLPKTGYLSISVYRILVAKTTKIVSKRPSTYYQNIARKIAKNGLTAGITCDIVVVPLIGGYFFVPKMQKMTRVREAKNSDYQEVPHES